MKMKIFLNFAFLFFLLLLAVLYVLICILSLGCTAPEFCSLDITMQQFLHGHLFEKVKGFLVFFFFW